MASITDRIRPYVDRIIRAAARGNVKASRVVELHRMHVKCPSDPGAEGLCEAAFDDWLSEQKVKA